MRQGKSLGRREPCPPRSRSTRLSPTKGMKVRKEAKDRGSNRPSSKRGASMPLPTLPRRRAGQPRPARQPDRQCGGRPLQSRPLPGQAQRSALSEQPPPFGLTFRAMIGTHGHPTRISGSLFLTLSVSALLALALFPVLVQADSSGIQYSDAPPTATGKEPVHTETNEPPAKSSKSPNGGASAPSKNGSSESNSSEGGSSGGSTSSGSDGGSSGPTATGNDGDAGQQGSPDKTSSGTPTNGVQTSGQASSKPASTQSDNGGSSPLIPILIAIAVLA